jgi:hypothetical protein
MQRDDEAGHQGAADAETTQDYDQQQRRQRMERDVYHVIREEGVAPQAIFDPEGRMQNEVVLLRGANLEPDPTEAVRRLQIWPCQVARVVPHRGSVQGGRIREEQRDENQRPL